MCRAGAPARQEPAEPPIAADDSHVRGVFEIRLRDDGARAFAVYDGKIARPRMYVEYPVDDVTEDTVRELWELLEQIAPAIQRV